MSMQLYPENIRRFVEELAVNPPGLPAGWKDQEIPVIAFLSETSGSGQQASRHYYRNGRKGVDTFSTVPIFTAEKMEQ
jgi:hypothetical protein